ncbi:hypothetical protein [Candidatus Nitrospira bockiana]
MRSQSVPRRRVLKAVAAMKWTLVATLLTGLIAATCPFFALVAQAEALNPAQLAGFVKGEVTAVGKDFIAVNHKKYELREDVAIQDDRARPRALKEIEPGSEVLYHLRMGRIDQLVLILPK